MAPVAPRSGDAIFANIERVNAELFTLTYGAIVRQLLTDLEEVEEVNKQLDQMGYNIGIRLIDEFLAKSNVSRCWEKCEKVYPHCGEGHAEMALLLVHLIFGNL
ncbi:hypothetical protein TSUD_93700 [Trifolium subterraneum]|uniref:Trafficking protein particle complex subunit n=1 Tax=Trifolium subterraneum TaxID=3900 RepID=A0A2Z6NVB7_TRISU|nr:hypothetical protein TSUD_93700 [Trifolium subterraneum]